MAAMSAGASPCWAMPSMANMAAEIKWSTANSGAAARSDSIAPSGFAWERPLMQVATISASCSSLCRDSRGGGVSLTSKSTSSDNASRGCVCAMRSSAIAARSRSAASSAVRSARNRS